MIIIGRYQTENRESSFFWIESTIITQNEEGWMGSLTRQESN